MLQKEIVNLFNYNEDSGSFTWKEGKRKGKEAGCIQAAEKTSYRRVRIKNKLYLVHRLIWIMIKDDVPEQIDHINRNGLDNSLVNLRNVSHHTNLANKGKYNNNTSGYSGINIRPNGKWQVEIRREGKRRTLGTFNTIEEAIKVRIIEEEKYKLALT